jgi:hypothetical protein
LDGAKYYVVETPFATDSVFWDFVGQVDPGFVWNIAKGWNRPSAGLLRQEPRNEPQTDLWLFAFPPEYRATT